MEKNDFAHKLKGRLTGFEPDVPSDAWAAFEAHRRQKDRRPFAAWWLVAAVVLLAGGVGVGVWRGNDVKNKTLRPVTAAPHVMPPPLNTGKERSAEMWKPGREHSIGSRIVGHKALVNKRLNLVQVTDSMPTVPPSAAGSSLGFLESLPFRNQAVGLQLPGIKAPGTPARSIVRRRYALELGAGLLFQTNFTTTSQNRSFPGLVLTAGFPVTRKLSIRTGVAAGRSVAMVENTLPKLGGSGVKWLNKGIYRWWNADVPLEVQYAFIRKPHASWYAAIGMTSSVHWREHYEEQYRDDRTILTTVVLENGEIREVESVVTQIENRTGDSQGGPQWRPFTFLNASVGVQRQFSPGIFILAEPYVRYPVGGVTSRHLKFTSLGIQLKVSFHRP
nr:hypothetical protein [uncultured Dyadobacter sp.]